MAKDNTLSAVYLFSQCGITVEGQFLPHREFAAQILSKFRRSPAVEPLITVLQDMNPNVRRLQQKRLGRSGVAVRLGRSLRA
jgi:HEAT repeat protein